MSKIIDEFEKYDYLGKGGYGVVRGFEDLAIKKLRGHDCEGLKHEFNMSKRIEKHKHILTDLKLKYIDILYTANYLHTKNDECFLFMPRVFTPQCTNKDHKQSGTISFSLYSDDPIDDEINNRHILSGNPLWSIIGVSDEKTKQKVYREVGNIVAFIQVICKVDPNDFQGFIGNKHDSGRNKLYVADFGMYKQLIDVRESIVNSIILNAFLPIYNKHFWRGYLEIASKTKYFGMVKDVLIEEDMYDINLD